MRGSIVRGVCDVCQSILFVNIRWIRYTLVVLLCKIFGRLDYVQS